MDKKDVKKQRNIAQLNFLAKIPPVAMIIPVLYLLYIYSVTHLTITIVAIVVTCVMWGYILLYGKGKPIVVTILYFLSIIFMAVLTEPSEYTYEQNLVIDNFWLVFVIFQICPVLFWYLFKSKQINKTE